MDNQLQFFKDFFTITAYEYCDDFYWTSENNEIHVYVLCNDLFYWACGDTEEITPENLETLKQAIQDCEAAGHGYWGPLLFACRARKMRPQGAWYEMIQPNVAALFDEAGPLRDPKEPGNTSRRKYKGP